ncbi:hypothetical protein QL285_085065 [Trifolium repens]|nr:hypothetical protein QL285_085065 [Trifolium repens]
MLITPWRTHNCLSLVSRGLNPIFLPSSCTISPFFHGLCILSSSFLERTKEGHSYPPYIVSSIFMPSPSSSKKSPSSISEFPRACNPSIISSSHDLLK